MGWKLYRRAPRRALPIHFLPSRGPQLNCWSQYLYVVVFAACNDNNHGRGRTSRGTRGAPAPPPPESGKREIFWAEASSRNTFVFILETEFPLEKCKESQSRGLTRHMTFYRLEVCCFLSSQVPIDRKEKGNIAALSSRLWYRMCVPEWVSLCASYTTTVEIYNLYC